ncbi:MAG: hypothetical protein KA419_19525 [Acidobacteria bacterium]|nr:hypothetical protein [Acidobacteriota bacterium]
MSEQFQQLTPAQIVNYFIKYLADEVTALDVQDVLQIVLRTEGRQLFTPGQIAKISHRWAQAVANTTGTPIYESFCKALLRIYQANSFCSLPNFDLNQFVKPFISELYALCPVDERDAFKTDLPNVKRQFQQSIEAESKKRMPEYEVQFSVDGENKVTESEYIQITGERFQIQMSAITDHAADTALTPRQRCDKIAPRINGIRDTFQNIISETVLKERLIAMINTGKELFNREEIESANLLLGFVAEIVDQRKDQFLERDLAAVLTLKEFNQAIIDDYLQNPEKKRQLKPLFANIFETRPQTLLGRLVQEEDPQQRKLLMQYITVFEPEVFHTILRELRSQTYSKWFFIRNLLLLTTKVERPADVSVAEILEMYKIYLTPTTYPGIVKEAAADYLFYDPQGGTQLFIQILTAENPGQVIDIDPKCTAQDLDKFKDSLVEGIGTFDFAPFPDAIGLIAQNALEESKHVGRPKLVKIGGPSTQMKTFQQLLGMFASTRSNLLKEYLNDIQAQTTNPTVKGAIQSVLAAMEKPHQQFI